MIKKFNQFVNENISTNNDLEEIMSYVHDNISSKDIPSLLNQIEEIEKIDESINEGIFSDIKDRLVRWFDDKMMRRFVNKKKDFYSQLCDKLKKYDLTTLEDVKEAYPRFQELTSIYLAGGMDKATDVGAGWRNIVEYIFEIENPGRKTGLEPIKIDYKGETYEVSPSYVIDDYHLTEAIEKGKSYLKKNYDTPAIFNPVRKEVDRTKNIEFAKSMTKFKSGDYGKEDPFKDISKTFSETIEPEDEKIVIISDAIFYGEDGFGSAGTFGELQQASFQQTPVFAWYKDWDIHGHSPWTIPHVTKIMRTEDDVRKFIKTMINY